MAYSTGNPGYVSLAITVLLLLIFLAQPSFANSQMNVIDRCWRTNPNWRRNRQQLATCSVGFAGKMRNNIGRGVTHYKVTDPSDNPINPKIGTLRYGTTKLRGKVWITFQRNMQIKLLKPLLVSSFTSIDGRGVDVHIAGGGCFLLQGVTNVIIHGLRFHHCRAQVPGPVMGPGSKIVPLGPVDGDAIRMVGSSKIWIDHNTLYQSQDGLIDVTRGSTDITISNNWFRDHDKVMLLGHDDGFVQDRNMRVTVIFNHFGPNCHQRMPRVRHGYAHVANNLYQGWGLYAIGGSMNPSIRSEANLFIAPKSGNKEVTWRQDERGRGSTWNWSSVKDRFVNGAYSSQRGNRVAKPRYNRDQSFPVSNVGAVRALTSSSGALRCTKRSRC
ncbi:Pectate lyase/Amb allergen [Macleaya cordata]|uniref:Pectate lyase n=1 Tax=Macleaya cordata TaxID=56857 RepID=A0A200QK04_MACCD|nr:Pectate lyase/Amb allergen [Macleaya cordata]